ncbi:ankyrin repeat domain-containing protein [Wolbachia endosymbiont of Pentalonia nigronervosa]|uniref:ankyrin repeat domain-containing protein n=1 Tax=Wolbachia endosymbiont of Pentalonia nigronervosa TaxID=1301914 RepID=UPI00165F09E3|nr:ankyrin repeat domain-containing protein [Wolbachia endosymbiont of Pentalonia nigronervosa]
MNISDAMGVTLIHIAAKYGRTDLMKILIDHGADVNVLDNAQRSPLDEAVDKNYVEAVRFLLGKGASISDSMRINVDQKKYSPEMIVMLLGHPSFEIKNQTTAESSKGNETNPVTSESMPEPTIMQDSASDNKQNNGQGSSSSPQETATSEPMPKTREAALEVLGFQGMNEAYIKKLLEFKDTQNKHIKKRRHTSTEEKVSQNNEIFLKKHPQISFERSKEANYQTFGAHGTNAFVLFLAFAFANGQLLPGNVRKQTGVPRISGESQGKSRINSNFVSVVTLLDNDSSLFLENEHDSSHPNFYAEKSVILSPSLKACLLKNGFETENALEEHYKNLADARYTALMKSFVNKYKQRGEDADLLDKITEIFKDQSMREVCIKLLNTPLITLGDGIGRGENKKQEQAEMGFERKEVLYERMNVRSIIIDEESQGFLKELISAINPEIAKNIAWFTNQEIEEFENKRWNITDDTNSKRVPEDRFLDAFITKFGNRLNFTISQDYYSTNIQRSFLYSYSPIGQRDAKGLTILKKEDQPKVYSKSVVYFHHAQTRMQSNQPPIVNNQNSLSNGTTKPIIPQSSASGSNQNNGQGSSLPENTATLKPMPKPTTIPVSTFNSNQNNGQSNSSPKKTTTLKPMPGSTIIPGSTLNSNQNNGQGSSSLPKNTATSQRFIIPQNSSSDNKQSNNTRSLLIDSATVVGAIIGAVALYCFAPFILGISVGIGAQLGLGIAGAAIGGGIGYLTGVAISCCSSKAHAA